ncbi:hypothetical protein DFH07DRAFT_925533 [Mycena maculata]|uniref:Uncharacterized protein n=1 Tax=Mycena maculata TaxID=230809 RepID=A0AAD7II37_9AGAR|nr:hypothetical protein DFH07DRAFT_925533 [Mycena maculata]
MPRILPRLIKLPLSGQYLPLPRSPRPPPLRKPVPPLPSALPADYPRSALLSPKNIITNSQDYARHKSMPPVRRLLSRRRKRPNLNEHDPPREMSAQERTWWSSPYLRMLASPIRRCILTERYMPMAFLIRLAPTRLPFPLKITSKKTPRHMILPDGLQHPLFKMRKAGHGMYLLCSREWLALYLKRGKQKRTGVFHPRLAEQIAHLLRLRVLQELELIARRLEMLHRTRTGPAPMRPSFLRRLTRAEWGEFRTTGIIPQRGALAILVVPPVNRDPTTRQRPPAAGAMGAGPIADMLASGRSINLELFDATAMQAAAPEADDGDVLRVQPHAEERVPLYNGVTLFPGRVQRARLHTLLTRILGVEAAWRFSSGVRGNGKGKGDNKGSHAFLVCPSDEVDAAALAVALWRVRMWEGGGFPARPAESDEAEEERWPWVEEIPLHSTQS